MEGRCVLALSLLATVVAVGWCFPDCPGNNWEVREHDGYCNYVQTGIALKYDQAVKYCKDKYGEQATIPTIHNQDDNDFYMKFALGRTWIALVRDNAPDAKWHWTDGSAVDYLNWNHTTTNQNLTCTVINDGLNYDRGKWFAVKCNMGRKLICKAFKASLLGWRPFGDYEYFAELSAEPPDRGIMEKENITWFDARRNCMKWGGDLLSVQTHEEQTQIIDWLKDSRPELPDRRMWIGLNTLESDDWQWSDDSKIPLKYWGPNFPIGTFTGAKCVYHVRNGRWRNSNCGIKQNGFICKRRKGSTTPITQPPPIDVKGYCLGGYYSIGNTCYKVVYSEEPVTWREAAMRCRDEPGLIPDLASIHNQLETAYLAAHLIHPGREVWLGGTTMVEGRWGWADTSPMIYTHLADTARQDLQKTADGAQQVLAEGVTKARETANNTLSATIAKHSWLFLGFLKRDVLSRYREQARQADAKHAIHKLTSEPRVECLSVGAEGVDLGRWLADDCDVKKPGYVCQTNKDPDHIISTPMPQPVHCPNDFKEINTYCYHLVEKKVNWTTAYGICTKKMAYLVSIENEAENNAVLLEVLQLQEKAPGESVWIWTGYQDLQNTKKYEWIDGTPSNYTQWKKGQPSRRQNGGCVALREGSGYQEGGIWEDRPCTKLFSALCKRPKAAYVSSNTRPMASTGMVAVTCILSFLRGKMLSIPHRRVDL